MTETLLPDSELRHRSPRTETARPSPPDAPACPRCGGGLIDPAGLGWCKACGYCQSLEDERAKAPPPKPAAPAGNSFLGAAEFVSLLARLPVWVWQLFAGLALVVLGSVAAGVYLPADSLPRCLWCTCQLAIGLVFLLVGQFWALMILADSDDRLSFKDAIFSGRLWILAACRLPETRRQVTFGAWGLAAILSAFLLVGGLTHWLTYLPGNPGATPPVAAEKAE